MVKKETPQQNQVQTYMNWKRDVPPLTIAPFSSLMYSSVKSRASLSPIPTPLSFTQEMREKAIALTRMSIAAAEVGFILYLKMHLFLKKNYTVGRIFGLGVPRGAITKGGYNQPILNL